jgi:hypothetical protein
VCGWELRRTPDVLDELVQAVIDEGGAVEHVAAATPLREHISAGTLRCPCRRTRRADHPGSTGRSSLRVTAPAPDLTPLLRRPALSRRLLAECVGTGLLTLQAGASVASAQL